MPLNQKDEDQLKHPYGWCILINRATRKYDYLTSDLCYLSKDHEGNISSSEKDDSDSFLILRNTNQGRPKFEFSDDKHELSITYKTDTEDEPIEIKIEPHKSEDLFGMYVFNYRDVHFQISPLKECDNDDRWILIK